MSDLYKLDATAQAELVAKGAITPAELVEAAINRIQALNPAINFLAGHDFDRALERARTGGLSGPFAGVPTLLKDTISYPGMRLSVGSRLFAQQMGPSAPDYVNRLEAAGFVVVGKSTTSEFALLGATETRLEGITRNPWSLVHSPGGSSGGAAAAVASGAVSIAHGSDGGGSVRGPASLSGLFGLKPSRGRNVSEHIAPNPLPVEIVSQHALTRSVRDSARYLTVTQQTGPGAPLAPVDFIDGPARRRLKIGYYTATLDGQAPDPDVLAAVEDAAKLCAELGHEVIPVVAPRADAGAFYTLAGGMLSGLEQMMSQQLGRPLDDTHLEPFTLQLIDWFRRQPPNSFELALKTLDEGARVLDAMFATCDVTLCPTLAQGPRPIGYFTDGVPFAEAMARTKRFVGYTPIHNLAGVPAMSVPLHWTQAGLPIGSQFAAPLGGEATLLALAYELEAARPWRDRWPAIAEA